MLSGWERAVGRPGRLTLLSRWCGDVTGALLSSTADDTDYMQSRCESESSTVAGWRGQCVWRGGGE